MAWHDNNCLQTIHMQTSHACGSTPHALPCRTSFCIRISVRVHSPDSASQSFALPFKEAVATSRPSSENFAQVTRCPLPPHVWEHFPDSRTRAIDLSPLEFKG